VPGDVTQNFEEGIKILLIVYNGTQKLLHLLKPRKKLFKHFERKNEKLVKKIFFPGLAKICGGIGDEKLTIFLSVLYFAQSQKCVLLIYIFQRNHGKYTSVRITGTR
jgi:hypothetical protein